MSDKKKKPQWLGKLLKYGIPLIVSAGLCYLLFMGIDYREMLDVVRRQCNFNWLLLMMAIAVLSHVCRAARWRIQLKALHVDAPFYVLVYSIFGTYAVNLVFPRLGEIWRTGYIAQRQNARFTTVFGSMVADRLADTVTVVLILCLTLLVASGPILDYLSRNGETFAGAVAFLRSPWLWCVFVLCAAAAWLLLTVRSNLRWINVVQKVVKDLWAGFAVVFHMPGNKNLSVVCAFNNRRARPFGICKYFQLLNVQNIFGVYYSVAGVRHMELVGYTPHKRFGDAVAYALMCKYAEAFFL